MSEDIARKNALRLAEAAAYLERAQKALDEMDLRSLRGLTREQMAELRGGVKSVKDHTKEGRRILRVLDAARATYFKSPEPDVGKASRA